MRIALEHVLEGQTWAMLELSTPTQACNLLTFDGDVDADASVNHDICTDARLNEGG